MKNYNLDMSNQFEKILGTSNHEILKASYRNELEKIFCIIYAINYLKNRVEVKRFFQTDYFRIAYSCLLEAYSLLLNNYSRGSALVLRSALENYLKHTLKIINELYEESYKINDRSYSVNKGEFEKVINNILKVSFKQECKTINGKMEAEYKQLSGLSHSLTPESINNTLYFFFDINDINKKNIDIVIDKFIKVATQIFSLSIILCEPSLRLWDKMELETLLDFVYGSKKKNSYIKMIREY